MSVVDTMLSSMATEHSNIFIEAERGNYSISSDPARLDFKAIHTFLTQSYWKLIADVD
jgi:hypothetical protein